MATTAVCKFYRSGHCKFGDQCSLSHQMETCLSYPCVDEHCVLRHPPLCKFFARFRRCRFGEGCSYSHQLQEQEKGYETVKCEVENLAKEIENIKMQNNLMQSILLKFETVENEISQLKLKIQVSAAETKFKCDFCEFESSSSRGLNIHKTVKHKKKCSQPVIKCVRQSDGCKNLVDSYYNEYNAICSSCTSSLGSLLKELPYSSSLCPCCHEVSEGEAYSLCAECLDMVDSLGYVDSGWGAWHLDRDSGKIICINLDFN